MNNFAVEINGLEKTYKTESESLTILKNLDLRIEEGSKVVIIGESGSGKSTFLNIVGGLDKATCGSVKVGPYEITSLDEKRISEYRSTYLGLIFQFHYLLKDFTALENVFLPARSFLLHFLVFFRHSLQAQGQAARFLILQFPR